jgi:ribosomal protein S6
VPPNTITKELLRGYRMDEKIIRHAVVKVSSASGTRPNQPAFQEIDLNSLETE